MSPPKPPMLQYLWEILDEHTLPCEGGDVGFVEATWLMNMIEKAEILYRQYDPSN